MQTDPKTLYNCCQGFRPDMTAYNAFEIWPMRDAGHLSSEPCPAAEAEFWCVFGHLREGGIEAITDTGTREEAQEIAAHFMTDTGYPIHEFGWNADERAARDQRPGGKPGSTDHDDVTTDDEPRLRKACTECGGHDVWCNAKVIWNEDAASWDVEEVYEDEGWCDDCETTVEVVDDVG
jgi:hypothetical protein